MPQPSNERCIRCHSEHNGLDFEIIHWEPSQKAFDHTKTGYLLYGKHLGVSCQKCHRAEHVSSAERATIKVKDLNRTFLGLSQDCLSCHKDLHVGRLGKDCAHCHSISDWKKVTNFDHAKTRFLLTGGHIRVACQKCHKFEADHPQVTQWVGMPFGKCTDCHKDTHRGAFRATCDSCHTTEAWKQVSVAKISEQFDHAKAKYALLGKHADVRCNGCHKRGDFKRPLPFNRCLDCHKDPHHGQFAARKDGGACESCHTVSGFKFATYGVRDHAATRYPLEGKHAGVRCAKCHLPVGPNTIYKIKLTACKDCHKDVHKGQFAGLPDDHRCETCHTLRGFAPSTFTLRKHQRTRFPLTGGHNAIPCLECHQARKPPGSDLPAPYRFADLSCTECHTDPHRGEFGARMQKPGPDGQPAGCEACHSTERWTKKVRFDHATAKFPLSGAHRGVPCMNCHKPPNLEVTLRNVKYNSAPTECRGCHEEPHGKQFMAGGKSPECSSCHDTSRWKPSLFDHEKRTEYPLKGAHERVPCAGCHKGIRLAEGKQVLFYKPTPKHCEACHGPAEPKAG